MDSVLRTEYIQPYSHTNQMTSFQLPSGPDTYLSNLRIIDFSVAVDGTGDYAFNNGLCGVYSLLEKCELQLDGVSLEIVDACQFSTLHNQLQGHTATMTDVNSVLVGQNSFDVQFEDENKPANGVMSVITRPVKPTTRYFIDLKRVFSMLNSTKIIPSGLRVLIHYNQSTPPADLFRSLSNPPSAAIDYSVIGNTPQIAVDVVNIPAPKLTQPIPFFHKVVERLYIPTVADSTPQTADQRVQSNTNRFCRRVFVYHHTGALPFVGNSGCPPQEITGCNLTIDGKKLLDYRGYESNSETMSAYNDNVGVSVLPIGCNLLSEIASVAPTLMKDNGNALSLACKFSPVCFMVNQKVSQECVYNFERVGVSDITGGTSAIVAHVVSEHLCQWDPKTNTITYA